MNPWKRLRILNSFGQMGRGTVVFAALSAPMLAKATQMAVAKEASYFKT